MSAIYDVIGTDGASISWWQMSIRAVIVFLFLWALVRLGDRRTLGQISGFDVVIAMILGSTLSRTLTANAPFFPTLAASSVLIFLHSALAKLAVYSPRFGLLLKGRQVQLVEDGRMLSGAMRRSNISETDLREALRGTASKTELSGVKAAFLERSGKISFILQ